MKKITLCLMLILALIMPLMPKTIFAATVQTQEQFITAVENGERVTISKDLTIKLEKDITIVNTVTISKNVTLDLNGHTIKINGTSVQILVTSSGKLIIEDSSEGKNGLITNNGGNSGYVVQVGGKCEINGGTIESTRSSTYPLYVQNSTSTCTLNDGTIINSYVSGGPAINSKGNFIMNGGKVINKAAGTTGLAAAIDGGKITINGGTIEAAGTGIKSSNGNVNITGGTIEAGWFGLHTSNVTINPAEGKTVNINVPTPEEEKTEHGYRRAAALMLPDNKLKTGEGNEIYGGNFTAPEFMETKYVCNPDNMIVYGGIFTHEVPDERVAPGYRVNKDDGKYKVELNIPNIVDDELKADDEVEMGVTPEIQKQLKEILTKEIDENKEIQDALLERKTVDIHVQMKKVEEEDVKEELEAVKETSKDKKIAKVYDITLVVKVDGTQVDTISETSSKLKFKVLIPEELIKEGRTFFMYRYHEGEDGKGTVEEITGEIDDENYFVFESDRFSTYVLAYEDKAEEQDNTTPPTNEGETGDSITPPTSEGEEIQQPDGKPEEELVDGSTDTSKDNNIPNSETGDNVITYVVIVVVAMFGVVFVKRANAVKSKH